MARILIVGGESRAAELAAALADRGHAVDTAPAPEHLGELLPRLRGTAALCWLAGPELLGSLAAKLVDTHVRGFACEPSGRAVAERFAATFHMPTAVIEDDPVSAVESVLSG